MIQEEICTQLKAQFGADVSGLSETKGDRFVVVGVRVLRDHESEATALWPLVDTFVTEVSQPRDCKEFCVSGHGVDFLPQGGRPWPRPTKSISCSINS